MDIKIQGQQIDNLTRLMDKLRIETIPIVTLSEAKSVPNLVFMSSKEIEQLTDDEGKSLVVRVDEKVIDKIPTLLDKFRDAQHWYTKFNKAIQRVLGTGDGALFLSIMAPFSAQTKLEVNVKLATQATMAIRNDNRFGNSDLLLDFIAEFDTVESRTPSIKQKVIAMSGDFDRFKSFMDDKKKKGAAAIGEMVKVKGKTYIKVMVRDRKYPYKERNDHPKVVKLLPVAENKYSELQTYDFILDHGETNNHLMAMFKIGRYYTKKNGKINPHDLGKWIGSYHKPNGDLKSDKIVGMHKIFNFSLNLLDPNIQLELTDWMPVTLDAWMLYFFYPLVYDMEPIEKDRAKSSHFGNFTQYTYIAKIVQEQAAKFGMRPHELQALLWTAEIQEKEPNRPHADIFSSIDYMIKEFEKDAVKNDQLLQFVYTLDTRLRLPGITT